ncbi:Lymphoid-restricted membrane protein [Sciurus carolinensis]|uniref:Lymphoid-restricted membrane protein n=1 Tax=Sciurus carolinensis TaxID=30640 RepID=A0AA41N6C1_SCICA|nr:Lymphoid-restricted membrane protein [Sciurus carolinensis]
MAVDSCSPEIRSRLLPAKRLPWRPHIPAALRGGSPSRVLNLAGRDLAKAEWPRWESGFRERTREEQPPLRRRNEKPGKGGRCEKPQPYPCSGPQASETRVPTFPHPQRPGPSTCGVRAAAAQGWLAIRRLREREAAENGGGTRNKYTKEWCTRKEQKKVSCTKLNSVDKREVIDVELCILKIKNSFLFLFKLRNKQKRELRVKGVLSRLAEFLRLSLGFKCDWFTLEKRVKLEERSRDLAEDNLKKEITNCLKLLESLTPLCEDDNQAQEVIKKLENSITFLSQCATRVASRAEMLGAINQESRVSKAVEVMIQHVENLKRMYAKEHAELEELKQVLLQNERSFNTLEDEGVFWGQSRVNTVPHYIDLLAPIPGQMLKMKNVN